MNRRIRTIFPPSKLTHDPPANPKAPPNRTLTTGGLMSNHAHAAPASRPPRRKCRNHRARAAPAFTNA